MYDQKDQSQGVNYSSSRFTIDGTCQAYFHCIIELAWFSLSHMGLN